MTSTAGCLAALAALMYSCTDRPTAREVCGAIADAYCEVESECAGWSPLQHVECLRVFERRCCEANWCLDEDYETESTIDGVTACLDAIAEEGCSVLGGLLPAECRPPA